MSGMSFYLCEQLELKTTIRSTLLRQAALETESVVLEQSQSIAASAALKNSKNIFTFSEFKKSIFIFAEKISF